MLVVLRKTYTISVTIKEGSDDFWDSLYGKSGCDDVVEEVKRCLADQGFVEPDCWVRLERFSEEA